MSTSIVIIPLMVGFVAGLMTGVLTAYYVLVAWSRVELAISKVAQGAWPF